MNILPFLKSKFFKPTLFCLFFSGGIYSQNGTGYTMASSDVINLQEYGLDKTNADTYTGKVNISIPIYTIKSGNINYPIELFYYSGGIKVDQLATEVGLGWNLSRSLITRLINGGNDFDNSGKLEYQSDYDTFSQTEKDKQNYVANKTGYFLQSATGHVISEGHTMLDFIPDTYFFNAGDYSSSFFFKDVNTPMELNPKGTKIQAVKNALTINTKRLHMKNDNSLVPAYDLITQDFFNIYITTNKGVKYTFSDCDYGFIHNGEGFPEVVYPAEISAWHVTKIEDLNTGKKIDFVYENTHSNPISPIGTNPNYNDIIKQSIAQRSYTVTHKIAATGNERGLSLSVKNDILKKRLKKIIFEEGEIIYNYNNQNVAGANVFVRNDVFNSDCLTQIYIKDKNQNTIKEFNFTYDYFTSNYNVGEFNPDNFLNTYRYNRLRLLKVQEKGKPAYKFSYNESAKLPPINSFSVDFAGYFNNSPDFTNIYTLSQINPNPKLYFYPNNFEKSLLPFQVPGVSSTVLPGYFNREANQYASVWSLNKIEFPSGASSEFQYEPNVFEVFGKDIQGGGVRLFKQINNNGNGLSKTYKFSYLKDNNFTSGQLNGFPCFGFPIAPAFDVTMSYPADESILPYIVSSGEETMNNYWELFDKGSLSNEVASGSLVGYSKVSVEEEGIGKKVYRFTSGESSDFQNIIYRTNALSVGYYRPFTCFDRNFVHSGATDQETGQDLPRDSTYPVDFVIANSGIYGSFTTDKSYKRGKILEECIYDYNNQLLEKNNYSYVDNQLNALTYWQGYFQPSIDSNYSGFYWRSNGVDPKFKSYYDSNRADGLVAFMMNKKDITINQFMLNKKTTIKYDLAGNALQTDTEFAYNGDGFLSSKKEKYDGTNYHEDKYYYPKDLVSTSEPFMSDLVLKNTTSRMIKKELYKNVEKLTEEKVVYAKDLSTNNFVKPKYVYSKKETDVNGVLEKKLVYDLYDDMGNVIQLTKENGVTVSYVWGYNKTEIVAKIENSTIANIPANLITDAQTASNTGTEAGLITALNALRNASQLSNAMVTTYTFKPLVGISTATDPKGQTVFYNYDSFGNLINTKDQSGNFIKENKYNYKPQN